MNPQHTTSTGALPSSFDLRTFAYPTKAYDVVSGGKRYAPEDIQDQSKVGICTAISLTQNASKALGKRFSADFQYLIQKKYYDNNWEEGSSIFSALKAAKGMGLLPEENWTYTTQADRDAGYEIYIEKLKAIPDSELEKLLAIANAHRIKAYASVPVDRDSMAKAINESNAGILARFVIGKEWWTPPVEPLRKAQVPVSGHAITESNFDGGSFRIANTWGTDFGDKGTAYHILKDYSPTECWAVFYDETPPEIDQKLDARKKIIGQILDLLQQVISLLPQLA